MRPTILNFLKQQAGYISGEQISEKLSISRTAVWKHIQALRQQGYEIESHPRKGYCLVTSPDFLLPDEIRGILSTECFGRNICYKKQTQSTNTEARLLANNDCPHGTIVVAEEQLQGRGRLARGWFSPSTKGIWMSLVLRPSFPPQQAAKCTLLAAVAIRQAIFEQTGVECGIKWPNDILYHNKKLVGILTEMNAEMDLIHYIVIGMGINVNLQQSEFPTELQDIAISLSQILKRPVDRLALLNRVLNNLEYYYQQAGKEGFAGILSKWREVSCTLKRKVRVLGIDQDFEGIALDIDEDGALLVETKHGVQKVLAGDVSIRSEE